MFRILVVDDDAATLAIVQNVLNTIEGWEVDLFDSADRALEAFRGGQYDLVVSDYFMPNLSGGELLDKVRTENHDVAFIFLTANQNVETAIALMRSGADDYIVKPILYQELNFRARKTLSEKYNERQIRQVEREKELLELENQSLINWRILYAGKDITQTEQMIDLLSRTVNQGGGFNWLDRFKSEAEQLPDGNLKICDPLFSLVVRYANDQ